MTTIAVRVVAKYKAKKETEAGNTVYLYSEKQIAKRNKDKAKRLEGFRSKIDSLRKQVTKDIKSDDTVTRLTALAVGLIDHTYERVGNEDSADEGHYGVTGWTKSHVSFKGKSAVVTYVGKSGVKHKKSVTDASIVSALKKACDETEGKDTSIFDHEDAKVDATKVNAYLKDFDITAKDIRGFHANTTMQEHLQAARSKGGKLPTDPKEREKKLKDEFKQALEQTAEEVGHEAATLKNQYLVPGVEDQFLKDGTVTKSLDKSANSFGPTSVVFRFLAALATDD